MRLRTFTAEDMQDAMEMVRESLGENAIIISTKKQKPSGVQITAAYDDMLHEEYPEDDEWYEHLRNGNIAHEVGSRETLVDDKVPEEIISEIEDILLHHGVSKELLAHMMSQLEGISTQDIQKFQHYPTALQQWLTALIAHTFDCAPLELRHDSCRHILIGTPGAGKTLTTAKIAAYCVKYNQPVHVITTDNKRAGGVEQLSAITDILGIKLMVAESRQDLKAILSDIPLAETVIVDSAGANPYDFYELKYLAEYAGLIELEPILVYPAGSDPYEADEVARAFSFIGVEKMIVTRVDAARRFGGIFNAAFSAGLRFANITGSEKILGTFDPSTPESLTKLLMDFQPSESEIR